MGFTDNGGGLIYALFVALALGAGVIALITYVSAVKKIRETVIEDEGDKPDLIA